VRKLALTLALVVRAMGAMTTIAAAADPTALQKVANHKARSQWRCVACGCIREGRRSELQSTYGLNYDPRNFDTTEPYFFYNGTRAVRCTT
jgi:hypothetical protein